MKKKRTIIILVIILSLILIFCIFKIKKINIQDDFIFFKLFGQDKNTSQVTKENTANSNTINNIYDTAVDYRQYIFDVSYKNTKLESVNLKDTINQKTLVKEKLAPGTKGNFAIIITSNESSKYQVIFKSKNEKPQNLVFFVEGIDKKFSRLEDMQENLKGNIKENETKVIIINWEWQYENGTKGNNQDTIDAQNISKYNFDIYVIGNM